MIRMDPAKELVQEPALVSAVTMALGEKPKNAPELNNGWASLEAADAWISQNLMVRSVVDYRKPFRPKVQDFSMTGRAIACVVGSFVYVEGNQYWSFEDLAMRSIIRVWIIV